MNLIKKLPLQLGIHGTYKGYHYLVTTLELALEQEDTIILFSKTIFPEVARKYHTNTYCIERNIRTVINHCWNSSGRKRLQAIASYELEKIPTVSEFIDILYWHIRFLEAQNK